APTLSDYTKRLYKSVLKNFCDWALLYQNISNQDLSKEQRMVKKGLSLISAQSLREIGDIKVPVSSNQMKGYHKDSLSEKQRVKLLTVCESPKERAILSLMAWNGLRTIEVIRLSATDCDFRGKKIAVSGKGRSARNKEAIKLFAVPRTEVKRYLKESGIKSGKMFPALRKTDIEDLVRVKFEQLNILKKGTKYTPHSLRHTAGQIMYDKGVPLEFIQKTLRHSVMETTLVYAQRAIDRKYFKVVPDNI
ncbi:MAG: tyrosine-type recombinase/integrase, partial [Bacteroidota bacterium]